MNSGLTEDELRAAEAMAAIQIQREATQTLNNESPLNINFIDEDGEVLQLQTKPGELTSHVFDRYALQQGTPFLLSGIMYHYIYNGEWIPLSSTVGDIGTDAGDDPIIIYVSFHEV